AERFAAYLRLAQPDHRYADIEVADHDVLGDLFGGQRLQIDTKPGIAATKALDRARNDRERGRRARTNPQQPELLVANAVGKPLEHFDLAEDPVGIPKQQVRLG